MYQFSVINDLSKSFLLLYFYGSKINQGHKKKKLIHNMIVAQLPPFFVATSSASLQWYHLHSTAVPPVFFLKDILKSLFLETLTEIIHPSAGSMAFGKAVCPPIKTTVDIYTSTQISPVYLFLNVCVFLFLLLLSDTRKPTRSARLKSPSCIYKRITLSSLEASILRPFIQRTRSNNLS